MSGASGSGFDTTGLSKVDLFMRGVEAEKQFRDDDARRWYELARDAGHILADKKLAVLDERSGQAERIKAENAPLEAAAGKGDPEADLAWARTLWGQNRADESLVWVERAAVTGYRPALRELAFRRQQQRDKPEAERLYRQDAEHGDLEGLGALAEFLRSHHRRDEAISVYERMVSLGDEWAPVHIAQLHEARGRHELAERWYRYVVETGGNLAAHAAGLLGGLLVQQGRGDEAEDLLRLGVTSGAGEFHLAWLLETRGEYAEAEALYRDFAESDIDQREAMAGLARMLERRGEHEEAQGWRDQSEGPDGEVPPGPETPS